MTSASPSFTPAFRPKYISFDCYGTLIRFQMSEMAREFFADRIPAEAMDHMCSVFSTYRFDETLGPWKPYQEVIRNAVRRTAKAFGVEYREADADSIYHMVPKWGPHPDVPGGLSKIADKIPLVILSNAMNDQIPHNVALLGAPFHRVYTAESAQAYKPRMQAFEYMFDQLGCGPEVMMHVSSSFRYDQNTATDLGFGCRVFVGRGHEPSNANYRDIEIPHIGCLPAVVGL
ncbi:MULTISPECIES: haloacid dehalogenase type II [Novosphingobium]|uniref:2-haloacid dehalogenase n=1 Tax=Novosphingobium mathurense TaxID=428990 RepID=A0A1U6HXE8_9SPHN|nr:MULTISPECIES: haloacid dehalogenase type II [Novosphingobium]CDO34510.1 Haloacid dehalogenase, type II [Novosphingobium sp. KN65.2]SLK00386.1 2-haloacid dehalogenase [Novosphingobium mathurense]